MRLSTLILSALLIFTQSYTNAQNQTDVNKVENIVGQGLYFAVGGEPVVTTKFSKVVDGSPYFKNDFMKGSVILSGGKVYENLSLKLNLVDGTVIYLSEKNEELEATSNIREVRLTDVMSGEKFRFIHSSYTCNKNGRKWMAVLDTGKVQLLRLENRVIKEYKPYASATIEQTIMSAPEYYLQTDNGCAKVKNTNELVKQLAAIDPSFKTDANSKKKSEEEMVRVAGEFNKVVN